MGEHINTLARSLLCGDCLNDVEPVDANLPAALGVVVTNLGCASVGRRHAIGLGERCEMSSHLLERPFEIDGGGALFCEMSDGVCYRGIGCVLGERETDTVGRRRTDEGGATHLHGENGACCVLKCPKGCRLEAVWKFRLVDDLD